MNRRTNILMVEDNPFDVILAGEAMNDAGMPVNIENMGDGEKAMAFLKGEGAHKEAFHPDLILLDLNLPGRDGFEVLAEIKSDPALRHIPVIVLTTSHSEEDVHRAYSLQASCYITKPMGFNEFSKVVKSIKDFWFTVVQLPTGDCGS